MPPKFSYEFYAFKGDEPDCEPFLKQFLARDPKELWETKLTESQKLLKVFPDSFDSQILIAVSQAHLGRYSEAIQTLEKFRKEKPTNYIIASNLGTAYELNGDNHSALQWIKESIKLVENSRHTDPSIDPDPLKDTGWLRVKILEAKIAQKSDPDWFQTHSVLGYNFGSDERPYEPREFNKDSELSGKTIKALKFQLHERMGFVNPPDEVVADLLFDLGNLAAISNWNNYAKRFYDLASAYGYSKPILEKRKAFVTHQKSKEAPTEKHD